MDNLKFVKSKQKFDIYYKATIKQSMAIMLENKNGYVVLIKDFQPIGVLSESDIINALENGIDLDSYAYDISTKNVLTVNENIPVEFAFEFLGKHNIRRIILVNDDKEYVGVVIQEDLFSYLEEDVYKVDLKISDISKRGNSVVTADINSSIKDVSNLMRKYKIGSVIVLESDKHIGIITEKDILKLTYNEVDLNSSIEKYISKPLVCVFKDELVTSVIELLKLKNIRRAVVVDTHDNLVTILTNRDILKHIKGNYTRILQIKIKHAQEIMDFLPEAIIEIFDTGSYQLIHWMNQKAKKIFGNEIIEQEINKIFSKEQWIEIYDEINRFNYIEEKIVKIKGFSYAISGTLSINLNSRYIKLIFKDVTSFEDEKTKLQKEVEKEMKKRIDNEYLLMQQSKLAMMGEMIGHIAHQWRQPLSQLGGIFMNIDAAYNFGELSEEYLSKHVDSGNKLLKYMSETIDDFSNFFQPNKQSETFSVEDYIQNAINIINASLTYHHISLNFEKPDNKISIWGYPSEFSQVILNILVNAKDALIENKIDKPKISINLESNKEKTFISITDNAGGIDKKIENRIFDIYFTTKKSKQGTGLGLYISKLIIETKFKGKINVKNMEEGAKFIIEI